MDIEIVVLTLARIRDACSEINQGWVDSTQEEIVHTIDKPSMNSSLSQQSAMLQLSSVHMHVIQYKNTCVANSCDQSKEEEKKEDERDNDH
jgi:hypothetical protein